MLSNDKQIKVNSIKAILDAKGIIYEEKANGQINVDKISFWATSGKWYDPETGEKGTGINSFLTYLFNKDGISVSVHQLAEVEFVPEKNNKNLELATELFECIDQLYSVQGHAVSVKRLPDDLVKYAGIISVMYSTAKKLKENLEKE